MGELMAHFDDLVTDPLVCRTDLERIIDDPANVGQLFQERKYGYTVDLESR
jgi:hypothetical protein